MMDTPLFAAAPAPERPALPVPRLQRWQPLRIGLVELFHYDSEEFWFRDGHLLLRGNNGTGKSKVLSLTLPFLLDAQVKPSRIEPDGDISKKMNWNLLLGTHDRRMGYAWLEFGRVAEDGQPHYLTLGAGLSAAAARSHVDCWYFLIDDAADAPRLNQDLWLTSEQRVVLTRERLRDALQGRGQVFDTARSYRRAVDERLFRLGAQRYDALIDTLIQLRQPQLSKKPNEAALSNALSEALPPLPAELIADVAEAMGQLEEDRRQLEEYHALASAIGRFEQRYRIYAGTRSRREAGVLRNAQTEFDNASRARNEAQARFQEAEAAEERASSAYDAAERALKRARARLEILRDDPIHADANRLENSRRDAEARQRAYEGAERVVEKGKQRLSHDREMSRQMVQRVTEAEKGLAHARQESAAHAGTAGFASAYAEGRLAAAETEALVALGSQEFDLACFGLRELAATRRKDIALIRSRLADVTAAEASASQHRKTRDERKTAAEVALEQRNLADTAVENEGQAFIRAWDDHFASLRQLPATAAACQDAVAALTEWVQSPDGDNPARRLLQAAQHDYSVRSAHRHAAIEGRRRELEGERATLEDERTRLQNGEDAAPPWPHTRAGGARAEREGAPLWQLVDFKSSVSGRERAGLEAALETSGLLDAWVSPDGGLQTAQDGTPLLDVQVIERAPCRASLGSWLETDVPAGCAVPATIITAMLGAIACAVDDPGDSEAWVSPHGRFRLGTLAGTWSKPEALYIGSTARAAARARRLADIAERLVQLAGEIEALRAEAEELERGDREAADEWREAPTDNALRQAHLVAATRANEAQAAREALAEADVRLREVEQTLQGARQQLATDAADLDLPATADALPAVETALEHYLDAQFRLRDAASDLRQASSELRRQRDREKDALEELERVTEHRASACLEAEEADARFRTLQETVGTQVEELLHKMTTARTDVDTAENQHKKANEELREQGEARAIAGKDAEKASELFEQRSTERADAVAKFQRFAAAGLLLSAWPEAPLPDGDGDWTIDPALTLARRTEQALSAISHDDIAWARVQKEVTTDLTQMQSALSARGHQARAETSDWGLIVHIMYQNRPERPDRLAVRLAEEIDQRNELLTAKERAVLENHLQAEIAAEIQRRLQTADAQRDVINKELHSRPTSTGVRYRLRWVPLSEEEGAPVGFEAARKRLLNINADLWTPEDRRVVGAMLQQQIAAERERRDVESGPAGGSLSDQLARALDYRRWHRFRVERWQDGSWRKLSGPASSGERALGLTVPLFAAVASFYTQSNYPLAPRLMLLDEAFAGIDDAARAHCMGLIREFDLDFVITSEREWACYAELPGVSICQLQRKEGIDAVYVSRWTWDGQAKTRQSDPDRRFAPQ